MGTTLSVTTGFGFAVPYVIQDRYEKAHENDDDYEGFYEYMEKVLREEPLLVYDAAYFHDYSPSENGKPDYAVLVKSTSKTEYGAGVFEEDPVRSSTTLEDVAALHRVAKALNMGTNPKFARLTVVSCG